MKLNIYTYFIYTYKVETEQYSLSINRNKLVKLSITKDCCTLELFVD